MSKCLFDFKGEDCPILEIDEDEKCYECSICWAKCTDKEALKERFVQHPNTQIGQKSREEKSINYILMNKLIALGRMDG